MIFLVTKLCKRLWQRFWQTNFLISKDRIVRLSTLQRRIFYQESFASPRRGFEGHVERAWLSRESIQKYESYWEKFQKSKLWPLSAPRRHFWVINEKPPTILKLDFLSTIPSQVRKAQNQWLLSLLGPSCITTKCFLSIQCFPFCKNPRGHKLFRSDITDLCWEILFQNFHIPFEGTCNLQVIKSFILL